MTLFSYGFGIAMSLLLAGTIGNTWVRENRRGVWTKKIVVILGVVALILGVAGGWCLQQYLDFAILSATHRGM